MSVDLGAVVLHKILSEPNTSLESWSKIKLAFFSSEFVSIYSAISKYYSKHGSLPCFDELDITVRDKALKNNIKALSTLECPEDLPLDIAVEALLDEYTQSEALKRLEMFVDNVTLLDSEEIKRELTDIVMQLEEKTHTPEKVCLMSDITIIEEVGGMNTQVPLGFSNTFDSEIRAATSELIMLGGKRGSGKSVLSVNIYNNQYSIGNTCLFFTIEMPKKEIFERSMAGLANVPYTRLRNSELTSEDYDKLAKIRADQFLDTEDIYTEYLKTRDYRTFEIKLVKEKQLKPDNQMIIIDNQRLTLADIDVNIQKFKAQFGDKLKVVVVDYVNQIEIDDMYNWKQQIMLSKQLKNFARKYDVVMVTPYQIDNTGEARFAKGLLDSADIAFTLEANSEYLAFESTKTRGTPAFSINSEIDWTTLKVFPQDYIPPTDSADEVPEESIDDKVAKTNDLPWN